MLHHATLQLCSLGSGLNRVTGHGMSMAANGFLCAGPGASHPTSRAAMCEVARLDHEVGNDPMETHTSSRTVMAPLAETVGLAPGGNMFKRCT